MCLKFHPDLPDRPFFPISVYHGPWAGPTPVKEPPLGACGAPGPGEALRMGAGPSERPTLFLMTALWCGARWIRAQTPSSVGVPQAPLYSKPPEGPTWLPLWGLWCKGGSMGGSTAGGCILLGAPHLPGMTRMAPLATVPWGWYSSPGPAGDRGRLAKEKEKRTVSLLGQPLTQPPPSECKGAGRVQGSSRGMRRWVPS